MRGLAIAAALLGVHVALGLAVRQHGALGVDRAAFDALEGARTPALIDVVRVLTNVAALPAAALAVVLAALYARHQGRGREAIVLIAGLVVLFVLVNLAKELWDRPRPPDRLSAVHDLSYPSGHAAYAVAWLAASTATRSRVLIAGGVILVLAIGLSRLYLHVHYLTDVVGGAALAGAVFLAVLARR